MRRCRKNNTLYRSGILIGIGSDIGLKAIFTIVVPDRSGYVEVKVNYKLIVTYAVQGNGSDIGIDIWTFITNRKRIMMTTVCGYTIVISKCYPDHGYFTGLSYTCCNQSINTIL